jgi:hypothetical protein
VIGAPLRTDTVQEALLPGEQVLWRGHEHPAALLVPAFLGLMGYLCAVWLVAQFAPTRAAVLEVVAVGGALWLAALGWAALARRASYCIVSDRRVIRCRRLWPVMTQRSEAAVQNLQDISVHFRLLGRWLDFGDVVIRTAGRMGELVLPDQAHPQQIYDVLSSLQSPASSDRSQLPQRWHKHPIDLLQRVWRGLMAGAVLVAAAGIALSSDTPLQNAAALWLVWGVMMLVLVLWLVWQAIDYWNDCYTLTDDRLIAVERQPLGLSDRRREGAVERVQSVTSTQHGIWANLLDYGDVVVRTAADDAGFALNRVRRPHEVQAAIFARVDAAKQRQARQWRDAERDGREAQPHGHLVRTGPRPPANSEPVE